MRYTASEKLEIIELVERSNLAIRRTLGQLGIPKSTFYGWYRRYVEGGFGALEDQLSKPAKIWNKVPPKRGVNSLSLGFAEIRGMARRSVVIRSRKSRR